MLNIWSIASDKSEFNNSFVKNFLTILTIVKVIKIQRENNPIKLLILSKIYIRRSGRIANQKAEKKMNETYTIVIKIVINIYTSMHIYRNKNRK